MVRFSLCVNIEPSLGFSISAHRAGIKTKGGQKDFSRSVIIYSKEK